MLTIEHMSILDWANSYDGEPFHALLCDPPYHLTELNKRFSKPDSAPPQYGTDGAFQRAARGFMGKAWDGGSVAFEPETWAALARHLYPGAFGMAFAGSRGWHRMAIAIEQAGLIVHPTIFCWCYGSGFPKATRVDTQLDRRAGATRKKVGTKKHQPKFAAAELGYREKDNGYNSRARESFDITAPATPAAEAWQGHRYGLQALKPAVEPIIVFQKPYNGSAVENISSTGAGAINIDGARIAGNTPAFANNGNQSVGIYGNGLHGSNRTGEISDAGRWPANAVLAHHPLCGETCHEDCAVRRLGAQSGERASGHDAAGTKRSNRSGYAGALPDATLHATHGDSGTAARYFYCADWMLDRLEASDPLAYYAKASAAEREAGLDPLQTALIRELYGDDIAELEEDTINDGRAKSIDNPYQRGETERRNTHPTIKPLSLARWLATLLLPPDAYAPRRLLNPFSGTSSEMIGAMLAGWEQVTGIELEADHVEIARARIRYWEQQKHRFDQGQPIKVKLKSKRSKADEASVEVVDIFSQPDQP